MEYTSNMSYSELTDTDMIHPVVNVFRGYVIACAKKEALFCCFRISIGIFVRFPFSKNGKFVIKS